MSTYGIHFMADVQQARTAELLRAAEDSRLARQALSARRARRGAGTRGGTAEGATDTRRGPASSPASRAA